MLIWSSILNRFLAALILISAAFACQPRRIQLPAPRTRDGFIMTSRTLAVGR
jgi:hypothetical protein